MMPSLRDSFQRAVAAWEQKGNAENFAAVITAGRDAAGLTNAEVAEKITVKPERIAAWLGKEDLPHPHIRGMVVTALKKMVGPG